MLADRQAGGRRGGETGKQTGRQAGRQAGRKGGRLLHKQQAKLGVEDRQWSKTVEQDKAVKLIWSGSNSDLS